MMAPEPIPYATAPQPHVMAPEPHAEARPRVAAPSPHQYPPAAPVPQFVPPPHQYPAYPAAHTTTESPPAPTVGQHPTPAPVPHPVAGVAQHHPAMFGPTPPANPIGFVPPPAPAVSAGCLDTLTPSTSSCPYMAHGRCFLAHLKTQFKVIKQASHYFEPKFDTCYCPRCYNAYQPDVLDPDGPG